jgi:diguanylate cyclase (GGDEF)-like protein
MVFARLPFSAAAALCICASLLFVDVVLRDPDLAPNDASLLLGLVAILAIPSLCGLHCLERAIRRLYLLELIQRLNYERELAANAVLTDLSFTDALTGVPNRRRLDEALARLGSMTAPSAALLLIDIDFFKRFNDLYGHAVGDDCLRSVALCLMRELRTPDLLARLGGEEFAVLLTDITLQDALALADRLRRAVEQTAFPVGSETATITVSVGLATMPPNPHPEALFAAADEALYRAKSLGRNRVCGPRWRMGHEAELSPLAKA